MDQIVLRGVTVTNGKEALRVIYTGTIETFEQAMVSWQANKMASGDTLMTKNNNSIE